MEDNSASLKAWSRERLAVYSDPTLLGERDAGLYRLELVHAALPEVDLPAIDTGAHFLGRAFKAPFLIASLAGGSGPEVNRRLAGAAEEFGLPLMLGPARVVLLDEHTRPDFAVRELAPSVPIYATLELSWGGELCSVEHARQLVSLLDADALVLRLNLFEEALAGHPVAGQGALARIAEIAAALRPDNVPVIVAEPGFGLDEPAARQLIEAGVDALAVVGFGGISPAQVAGRLGLAGAHARVGEVFRWGRSLAEAVRQVRALSAQVPLVAGGGVRNGVEAAKLLALGADLVSLTSPFMAAARTSQEAVRTLCQQLLAELRLSLFAVGARTLDDLRGTPRLRQRG